MRLVQSLRSTTQVPKSMRTLNASNFTSILGGKVSSSLACDKPEAGYGSLSVQVPGLIPYKAAISLLAGECLSEKQLLV